MQTVHVEFKNMRGRKCLMNEDAARVAIAKGEAVLWENRVKEEPKPHVEAPHAPEPPKVEAPKVEAPKVEAPKAPEKK